MKLLLTTLLFTIFYGCVSSKGDTFSALTINAKNSNSKIVNRLSDYGDGHNDGCLVMREIRLDLKTDKTGQIEGKISDVSTGMPLKNASVLLKSYVIQSIQLTTDSLGFFQTKIPGRLSEARVDYIGYRRMTIKL